MGMRIDDEIYVHGYLDEIRQDKVIIRNEGGYFGTIVDELVEAIPKADYENHLKADMMAMLEEIQLEIEESENCGKAFHLGLQMASNIIQQKIDAIKEQKDETDESNK